MKQRVNYLTFMVLVCLALLLIVVVGIISEDRRLERRLENIEVEAVWGDIGPGTGEMMDREGRPLQWAIMGQPVGTPCPCCEEAK